jgi:hypothetical protein
VKPEKIVVHYDRDGDGEHWEAARSLPGIEWRVDSYEQKVNGFDVSDQRLPADVFRLKTLIQEGGFYCDLDFVFLKPFDVLRHNKAVIGTQCKQKMKLCCAMMACVPDSEFMKAYLETYKIWKPADAKTFWGYANRVPWDLAIKMPTAVKILDRVAFYPVAWSNKSFWDGSPVKFINSYAVHLWEHLHPVLTVEDLRKTCLRATIDRLDEPSNGVVCKKPGILMAF